MDAVGATPVSRALWFIESHLTHDLTLEEIADAGCVSLYHMSRVFAVTMGCPIMRYVRGRRLTEAARALADGSPGILNVGASLLRWLRTGRCSRLPRAVCADTGWR